MITFEEVFRRDVDIGEDLEVGPPALAGAGLVVRGGGFLHFAGKLALLKMEVILITVRKTSTSKYSELYWVAQLPSPFNPSENS